MKNQTITLPQNHLKIIFGIGLAFMLSMLANPLLAQSNDRTVSGVVRSTDGPVLGASVVLKGTTVGVVTNEDGSFTFPKKLRENDVLLITFLGYKDHEIIIDRNTMYVEPYMEDIPVILTTTLLPRYTLAPIKSEINN